MWHALLAVLLAGAIAGLGAADLRVMSAGALETGLARLVEQFQAASGHRVRVEIGNAPQIAARLAAGDTADLLVAPAALMDRAIAERRVQPATRVALGRVGVAIVVRAGAPAPDVSSPQALRAALLAADAVVFNQGSSGVYIEQLLARLDVAARVKAARVLNGEAVTERILGGRGREMAFVAMPDAMRANGLRFVGPLPGDLQNYTTYDAAVMRGAREPAAAAAFLAFATSAPARAALKATGVD